VTPSAYIEEIVFQAGIYGNASTARANGRRGGRGCRGRPAAVEVVAKAQRAKDQLRRVRRRWRRRRRGAARSQAHMCRTLKYVGVAGAQLRAADASPRTNMFAPRSRPMLHPRARPIGGAEARGRVSTCRSTPALTPKYGDARPGPLTRTWTAAGAVSLVRAHLPRLVLRRLRGSRRQSSGARLPRPDERRAAPASTSSARGVSTSPRGDRSGTSNPIGDRGPAAR
jgi:hypothetical protein